MNRFQGNINRLSLEPKSSALPAQSHSNNPVCCDNPHLTLQLSCCLRRITATATDSVHLCKHDMPSLNPPCGVENGKPWRRYLFKYYHDGAWWSLDIPASSREDAQVRINKISFAQYDGEIFTTIKAGQAGSVIVRAICAFKNFFNDKSRGAETP